MPTDVYIWILYVPFGTTGDRHFHIDVGFCGLVLTVMGNDEGFGTTRTDNQSAHAFHIM